jgi:hypothetical protein
MDRVFVTRKVERSLLCVNDGWAGLLSGPFNVTFSILDMDSRIGHVRDCIDTRILEPFLHEIRTIEAYLRNIRK